MASRSERIAPYLFLGFIIALSQLLICLWIPNWAWVPALLSGGLALVRSLRNSSFYGLVLPFVLLGATGIGVLVVAVAQPDPVLPWQAAVSPLLAGLCAWLIQLARDRGHERCALCNRRLKRALRLACPRCDLLVCDQCWNFDWLRCRLCVENEVPALTSDARWWDRSLGPRFARGACQLCHASSVDADLRSCRKCGRPQCRSCWDMANGQCSRCHWVIEDLPPKLAELMRPGASHAPPDR